MENANPCKMFWCVPKMGDGGNQVVWDVEVFDSDGDDLSNWSIILHMLKRIWDVDCEECSGKANALPRGICADNVLYHGNNLPQNIKLNDVASKMGITLGKGVKPVYHNKFGINKDDMECLQNILGVNLELQHTER